MLAAQGNGERGAGQSRRERCVCVSGMNDLDRRPAEATRQEFHACESSEVLARLATQPEGLTAGEAARRLLRHGRNELPLPPPRHPLLRFLAQFNNALIYFLLAGAVAAWSLGHLIDASVIVVVVLVNAVVGFVQEGKAENALAAIRSMISPRANVMRDGRRVSMAVAEIVPGDIVLIEAGDRVSADLRLIKARGLLIDEAILTGEFVAAQKDEASVPPDTALGDRRGMAFSGTLVVAGQGTGVAVATGTATEIGRISELLGQVQELTTPLLRQINDFGRRFTWVALGGAALLFAFAVLVRDYAWADALIAVIALAVGVVPEGLPAVITITLAIGVQRMAARNAVVRRLPAVETLGATSVICSDKTGTLTRNEMTAQRIVVAHGEARAAGAGYGPDGELELLHRGGQRRRAAHCPHARAHRSPLQRRARAQDRRHMDRQWRSDGRCARRARRQGGVSSRQHPGRVAAARRNSLRRPAPLHGDAAPRSLRGRASRQRAASGGRMRGIDLDRGALFQRQGSGAIAPTPPYADAPRGGPQRLASLRSSSSSSGRASSGVMTGTPLRMG